MQDPKFFDKLKKGKEKNGIIARVIRKWTSYESTDQDSPLYIALVLADAKGDAMYAEIPDEFIKDKAHLFDIGKVYTIKKFLVTNAKKTHKAVDKDIMIEITDYTSVEIVRNPPATIPEYIYNITPFSAIRPFTIVYKYTDVIGYLIKYEALHMFVPKNQEKVKMLREIYIKDLRENVMKITLWGDHAANFNINDIYNHEAGNLIVCLVVGCIPRKDFVNNDKTALTGSAGCSYYFNPQIPPATPFYSRFKNTPVYIEQPPTSEEAIPVEPRDIELPQKTIVQLDDIDPFDDEEEGPFKCAVTITGIVDGARWWYMSCEPCKKKTEQQRDGTYKCPRCQSSSAVPRYTLTFIAADETGEGRFFAYDDEAQKMIQKDCQSIMNPLQSKAGLPQAIQNIINKKFVLSIDLSEESCKSIKKGSTKSNLFWRGHRDAP